MAGNIPITHIWLGACVPFPPNLHLTLIQPIICAVKTGIQVSGNGA